MTKQKRKEKPKKSPTSRLLGCGIFVFLALVGVIIVLAILGPVISNVTYDLPECDEVDWQQARNIKTEIILETESLGEHDVLTDRNIVINLEQLEIIGRGQPKATTVIDGQRYVITTRGVWRHETEYLTSEAELLWSFDKFINRVNLSPNGRLAITSRLFFPGYTHEMRDVLTGEVLYTDDKLYSVERGRDAIWSADSQYLAVPQNDYFDVIDVETGETLWTVSREDRPYGTLNFSEDSQYLQELWRTPVDDTYIEETNIYDIATGEIVENDVNFVSYYQPEQASVLLNTPNIHDEYPVTSHKRMIFDDQLRWAYPSHITVPSSDTYLAGSRTANVVLAPNETQFVMSTFIPSGPSILRVCDIVAEGAIDRLSLQPTNTTIQVAYTPDMRYLLYAGSETDGLRFYDPDTQQVVHEFAEQGQNERTLAIAVSPNSQWIALGYQSAIAHGIYIIDANTREILVNIDLPTFANAIAFSDNGQFLAIQTYDGLIRIYGIPQ